MKILYFGTFDSFHDRNIFNILGLRNNGIEVELCKILGLKGYKNIFGKRKGILKYNINVIRRVLGLKADLLFIGYPGHRGFLLGYFLKLIKRIPLVFDPYISFYNTKVNDWKTIPKNSLIAILLRLYERFAWKHSNLIITDTNSHAKYYSMEFDVPLEKMERLFLILKKKWTYKPGIPLNDKFTVILFGSGIPLQGIPVVFQAAKILQDKGNTDIFFKFYGRTKENPIFKEMNKYKQIHQLKNIELFEWIKISDEEFVTEVAKSHISLGIFGNSMKSILVVPNKAYAAIALKKPVITENSFGERELFKDGYNAILCDPNAESLVNAILKLYNDESLRTKIAENGYQTYLTVSSKEAIGKSLTNIIYSHFKPKK